MYSSASRAAGLHSQRRKILGLLHLNNPPLIIIVDRTFRMEVLQVKIKTPVLNLKYSKRNSPIIINRILSISSNNNKRTLTIERILVEAHQMRSSSNRIQILRDLATKTNRLALNNLEWATSKKEVAEVVAAEITMHGVHLITLADIIHACNSMGSNSSLLRSREVFQQV